MKDGQVGSVGSSEARDGTVAEENAVPLSPGLLEFGEDTEGSLLGGHCPSCGATFFPYREVCSRCLHEPLERTPLSPSGKVYTHTVVHQAPPGFEVPYVLVYVDLEDGTRVLGQLADVPPASVQIGMDVELSVEPIGENDEGRVVIGYRFHPAKKG